MSDVNRFLFWVACACLIARISGQVWPQPEQVHLSATGDVTEIMVTWNTFNVTRSVVQYGLIKPDLQATGSSTKFVDGGSLKSTEYIHRVKLTGLKPGTKYVYRCGSDDGWSPVFFFRALQNGTNWSPRLAIYGDMGHKNAQSLGRLQVGAEGGEFDAVIHVGDFAYNLDDNNGKVGDEFMREIESVAAYVPYMTAVGNHEYSYWNIGPAHFVVFSTEVYFYTEDSKETKVNQLKWLQENLKEANEPKNRAERPWIITLGHRPMYCTADHVDDCTRVSSLVRAALEDLFYKYGVDMEIWAHEHNYERLWPVYQEKVYNGSKDAPYTNPKAPVHIITGSAGCHARRQPFVNQTKPWDAFRAIDYGYTLMQLINHTHIAWEQISDDKMGKVIDKVMLIKDQHGPEAWL